MQKETWEDFWKVRVKELLEEIYFSLTKDRILVRKKWVCRQLSADSYAHLIPKLEKAIEQLKKESKNE